MSGGEATNLAPCHWFARPAGGGYKYPALPEHANTLCGVSLRLTVFVRRHETRRNPGPGG